MAVSAIAQRWHDPRFHAPPFDFARESVAERRERDVVALALLSVPHGHRPVVGFRPADVREVESFVGERPAERALRAFPDVLAPDGVLALPGDRCKATTD